MADDKRVRSKGDRKRININQNYEVKYWTKALGISKEQLQEAVNIVGDSSEKIRVYFKKPTSNSIPYILVSAAAISLIFLLLTKDKVKKLI